MCLLFASGIQLLESNLKVHLQKYEIERHKAIDGSITLQNIGNNLMDTHKREAEWNTAGPLGRCYNKEEDLHEPLVIFSVFSQVKRGKCKKKVYVPS